MLLQYICFLSKSKPPTACMQKCNIQCAIVLVFFLFEIHVPLSFTLLELFIVSIQFGDVGG